MEEILTSLKKGILSVLTTLGAVPLRLAWIITIGSSGILSAGIYEKSSAISLFAIGLFLWSWTSYYLVYKKEINENEAKIQNRILKHIGALVPFLLHKLELVDIDVNEFYQKLNSQKEIKDKFDDLYGIETCVNGGNCAQCIQRGSGNLVKSCLCHYLFSSLYRNYSCKIHSWSIMRYSPLDETLYIQVPGNLHSEEGRIEIKKGEGTAGQAIAIRDIYYDENISGIGTRFKKYPTPVPEPGFKSIISMPIIHHVERTKIIGVLNIQGVNEKEFGSVDAGTPEEKNKWKEIEENVKEFTRLLYVSILFTNQRLKLLAQKNG